MNNDLSFGLKGMDHKKKIPQLKPGIFWIAVISAVIFWIPTIQIQR
jgi:hypothetical protein